MGPADGTGSDERLLTRAKDLIDLLASGWSEDGRQLLFTDVPPNLQCAIGQIPIERPSEVKLLVKNESCNADAAVSPDGRWTAYASSVLPGGEIYVERYPELGNRQLVSSGGGLLPLWSRDGRELFFSTPDGRKMFELDAARAVARWRLQRRRRAWLCDAGFTGIVSSKASLQCC